MDPRLPQRTPVQINKLEGFAKVRFQTEKAGDFKVLFPGDDSFQELGAMRAEERAEGGGDGIGFVSFQDRRPVGPEKDESWKGGISSFLRVISTNRGGGRGVKLTILK